MICLNIGLSWKITKIRTTPLCFKIDVSSATSMGSSRRDLLNDMAEQYWPILINNPNAYNPRFSFPPITEAGLAKKVFSFLLCTNSSNFDSTVPS